MKISFPSFVGATLTALALIAAPSLSQAQNADGILVYNAQHASLTKEWAEAFTKETGIKVTIRQGGDTDLGNQIVQEGKASPADVFLTENSPAMALVENNGLFAPLDAATLAAVPAGYKPATGHWVGIAARTTVFVYNKAKLTEAQLPKSMLDLADASWKGRWAAAPTGADFQAIVSALLELKGEAATAAWLKGMKENSTSIRGNGAVMKAVNEGQFDGGIIYHYYFFGDRAKTGENSSKSELYYFRNQDPGAFLSVSGGGVLASSKHMKDAQAFVKFIVSKGGQDVLRSGDSYEYAVVGDSNAKLEPLAKLNAPKVEPSKLNSKKVTELMTAVGLL
jgi:iron(III) transport system substrate-binding protein